MNAAKRKSDGKKQATPNRSRQVSSTHLTPLEVARELGVCVETVYRMRHAGRIHGELFSRKMLRFPIEEVLRLKAQAREAGRV